MSTLADDLRDVLEDARGIPGDLGLRQWTVKVVVTSWDGGRPGAGNKTRTTTQLFVGNGTQNPKLVQLNSEDVLASGGKFTAGMVKVGPLTPVFPGGGTLDSILNPPTSTSATTVEWLIEGPNTAVGGDVYERVSDALPGPSLDRYIVLRSTGRTFT